MKKVFLILILNSGILFAQSASFDPSIQIESQLDTTSSVSYTHLTLPTNREV